MALVPRAGLGGGLPDLWISAHVLRSRGRLRLAAGDPAGALADLLGNGCHSDDGDAGRSAALSWRPFAAVAYAALGQWATAVAPTREQNALARPAAPPGALAEALLAQVVTVRHPPT